MGGALSYLQAKLIQLQLGWSVPAASNALALRQQVVGESRNVLHTVCVGGCYSVHEVPLGYIDNVGCYVLFIFKRARPAGNGEVVNVMHKGSVQRIPKPVSK